MSLIFIPLLAFNGNVVYNSQEFKQYSSDVLFTILYFIVFYTFKDKIKTEKDALILGIILGISGFFSICSEFLVAPILFYFLYRFIKDKNKTLIINLCIPYCILSGLLFFTTIFPSMSNGILNCWTDAQYAFATFDVSKNTILTLFGGAIPQTILFCALFLGLVLILLKDRVLAYILLCPLVLNMISGLLHLYPFTNNRFILYLLVNIIIICIYPIDFLAKKIISDKVMRNFVIMLIGICIFINGYIYRKIPYEELPYYYIRCSAKEYVNMLNTRMVLPDDIIFVDTQGDGSFIIYDTDKKYINKNRILSMVHYEPLNVYDSLGQINTLDEVPANSNIYFYNSRYYEDSADIDTVEKWISENCEILYSEEDVLGTFLYVKKIK
jgi:hypothetical protein